MSNCLSSGLDITPVRQSELITPNSHHTSAGKSTPDVLAPHTHTRRSWCLPVNPPTTLRCGRVCVCVCVFTNTAGQLCLPRCDYTIASSHQPPPLHDIKCLLRYLTLCVQSRLCRIFVSNQTVLVVRMLVATSGSGHHVAQRAGILGSQHVDIPPRS